MFNILVKYPTFEEELSIVNETTGSISKTIENVISADEIVFFQNLVRKAPIASNVVEYAVNLSSKTRPKEPLATEDVKKYISWGAGPRASQFLVIGAKCHALVNGKYSPDIEDVKAVAKPILRHRIVKNYIAEADGMSIDGIIDNLL
jgi:MoxR-like ATPase